MRAAGKARQHDGVAVAACVRRVHVAEAPRVEDQQRPPQGAQPQRDIPLARDGAGGAQDHPNLDLRSFRDYLIQQPKASSARDVPAQIQDRPVRGSLGEHASAEVMANVGGSVHFH